MTSNDYEIIATGFISTADVPKDSDLFYQCLKCGALIPSTPADNIGCKCGNIFIDKDYWRIVVVDIAKLVVVRKNG